MFNSWSVLISLNEFICGTVTARQQLAQAQCQHQGNDTDVKQEKETINERTAQEMSVKYQDFIPLMILHSHRVLNYFINYPAKKNWGIFNNRH